MIQDIITEPVFFKDIPRIVHRIDRPVIVKFFRRKHQHSAVPEFVIFDDCQSRESLSQSDAVSYDTAVELFQFLDGSHDAVLLEFV